MAPRPAKVAREGSVTGPISTFSADVDTGSYTLARGYLERNQLPPEAAVRVEEFVNAFDYGYRAPEYADLNDLYRKTRAQGFGAEVKRRILIGTYVLSHGYYDAYYRKAMEIRALIRQDFERVFASGVHVLLTPTAPTTAFKLGAISDPYEMYLSDIFTATANLAGIPGMSVPAGDVDGLPVGVQLLANHFDEYRMFVAAYGVERLFRTPMPRTAP